LRNLGGQIDETVEEYRTALVRLREKYIAHATVTTEVAILQTRDEVSRVDARLTEMSNQAFEAGA
jgi:mRNA-degrading endonuclease toxin of MazEF toxin-antitoxin module